MAMRDADKDRRKIDGGGHRPEPLTGKELKQLLMTVRAQRDEWQKLAKENQEAVSQLPQLQQDIQTYQVEVDELQERAAQNYQIYLDEQKSYQQALCLYNEEKVRATELIVQRDEWQQRANENEEAASYIQTYKVEVDEFKKRAEQNYQIYLDEQQKYQQALSRYNEAKAKEAELIAQRDEWQQRAKENQEAAFQLTQVRQDIEAYKVEVYELKESVHYNYQIYLDEQKNYQQTLCLYNEEKVRATELLAKYEQVNSERDNYVILYNEAQAQLKFERRSKAGIKGWETRRKAENERLKREISEMVVILRESLESKDEAINNLYVVAERMERIQSLVDSVEGETTNNPVGLIQKFQRIWLAIKEIISE
jgi:L-rhamnose mutarotase